MFLVTRQISLILHAIKKAMMGPEASKRKRGNGVKVPRKENFMKKILKNDKATKESSFLKRRPTLITKARQLQQFCGVSVGLVIQSPDGSSVDTWPENRAELVDLIASYKGLDKRRKKEVKLLEFLADKKRKLESKRKKAVKEKVDQLAADLSARLDGLSGDSLVEYVNFLNKKVVDLKEKIKLLEEVDRMGKQVVLDVGNHQTSLSDLGTNNFLSQENFGSCSKFWMGNKIDNDNFVALENFGSCKNISSGNKIEDGNLLAQENFGSCSKFRMGNKIEGCNFLAQENFGSCRNFSMGNKIFQNNNLIGQYNWTQDMGSFGINGGMNNSLPTNCIDYSNNFEQQLGNMGGGGIDQAQNQNNFGLEVEEEMLNDNMLLPNLGNVHVSPLDEQFLSGSVWSPWN